MKTLKYTKENKETTMKNTKEIITITRKTRKLKTKYVSYLASTGESWKAPDSFENKADKRKRFFAITQFGPQRG